MTFMQSVMLGAKIDVGFAGSLQLSNIFSTRVFVMRISFRICHAIRDESRKMTFMQSVMLGAKVDVRFAGSLHRTQSCQTRFSDRYF